MDYLLAATLTALPSISVRNSRREFTVEKQALTPGMIVFQLGEKMTELCAFGRKRCARSQHDGNCAL
ncbi:hypothetical protein [Bradyrhizobium sp.]|uniref:hypothetical protein n=1 Tax=Bradyrhizobium sp. TaxID=376 RepID=UPI003C31ED24